MILYRCNMDQFERDGFLLLKAVMKEEQLALLEASIRELNSGGPGVRHLLQRSKAVQDTATSAVLLDIAKQYLGPDARPVKAIAFDKTPESNWYVTWHQDLTIAVKEKIELPGFGPWSVKDEMPHVQPPAEVLENMIAIRIHIDDCGEENGALKFIPGSHQCGKMSADEIEAWKEKRTAICCTASRGDIIAMRPLILHSSSKASTPAHRRVVHIEYAATDLPHGLQWSDGAP